MTDPVGSTSIKSTLPGCFGMPGRGIPRRPAAGTVSAVLARTPCRGLSHYRIRHRDRARAVRRLAGHTRPGRGLGGSQDQAPHSPRGADSVAGHQRLSKPFITISTQDLRVKLFADLRRKLQLVSLGDRHVGRSVRFTSERTRILLCRHREVWQDNH